MSNNLKLLSLLVLIYIAKIKAEYISNEIQNITILEINTTIDKDHVGQHFFLEEEKGDVYLSHTFSDSSPIIGTFRIVYEQSIPEQNDPQVLCKFFTEDDTDEDIITELNFIDEKDSECHSSFITSEGDKTILEGIYFNKDSKKRLGFIVFNYDIISTNLDIYLRTSNIILQANEGLITVNETFTRVPYFISINDFREQANQIIFYSSIANLAFYQLNGDNLEQIYYGRIVPLITEGSLINRKIFQSNKIILISEFAQMTEEENYFEIKFISSEENMKIDYYSSIGRPIITPLSFQMEKPNENRCFILNYNKKEDSKKLYVETILGKLKSLKIISSQTEKTFEDCIDKAQEKDLGILLYPLEADIESHTDVICIENREYPSLINFYYVDNEPQSSLTPGKSVFLNIGSEQPTINIDVENHKSLEYVDLSFHVFNKENNHDLAIEYGGETLNIKTNGIINFKVQTSLLNFVSIRNKGQYISNILITLGLQVSEVPSQLSEDFYFDSENKIYYHKLPKTLEEINYSTMELEIKEDENTNGEFCFLIEQGNIIEPSLEQCTQIEFINPKKIKISNPYALYTEAFSEEELPDFYLVFKTFSEGEEIQISKEVIKYNYNERIPLGKGVKSTNTGFIVPGAHKEKLYSQVINCEKDSGINYSVYNAYNHKNIREERINENNNYFEIENNYYDIEMKFEEINDNQVNFFYNIFEKSAGVGDSLPDKIEFTLTYDKDKKTLNFEPPLSRTSFTYTIFIDHLGKLSNNKISICSIVNSLSNKQKLTDSAIVIEGLNQNSYQLDFDSEIFKEYESFDAVAYAVEVPDGFTLISNIVSFEKIETAIEIKEVFNEKILYYMGKLEPKYNYFSVELPLTESIITIHLEKKVKNILVDCALTNEIEINQIDSIIIEQENEKICKLLPSTANNNQVYNVLFKLNTDKTKKVAIRIHYEIEGVLDKDSEIKVGIFIGKDNRKQLTLEQGKEDIDEIISYPYNFKYYTASLNQLREKDYYQIGLFSNAKSPFNIILNSEDKIKLIDYGNLIVLNTNEQYITKNYDGNEKLIILIGDSSNPVFEESSMQSQDIKVNFLVLSKNNELINGIKILDYQSITSFEEKNLYLPAYFDQCDNEISNIFIVNNKNDEPSNSNFIKIEAEFGEISSIGYMKDFQYPSFKQQITHLITGNSIIPIDNSGSYIIKVQCNKYLYMNFRGFKPTEEKSFILNSNTLNNFATNNEIISVDLSNVQDNTVKIEISSKETEFSINAKIEGGEEYSLDLKNKKNQIIDLTNKNYKKMSISTIKGNGYIHLSTSVKLSDLSPLQNGFIHYKNELYISSQKVLINNNSTKIKIPVVNQNTKPLKVCYYLSTIIYDIENKKIPNCEEIPMSTTQNITLINPYEEKQKNNMNFYVILYKEIENVGESMVLDLEKVFVEDENKKEPIKPDDKKEEKFPEKSGRIALGGLVAIIVILVLLFLCIYIRKKQLANKELKYKQLLNKERELLSSEGNTYNPLMGGIISLEDK